MKYLKHIGFVMTPKEWVKHRRVLLNIRLGSRRLHVLLWKIRYFTPEDNRFFWSLSEFLFWRRMTQKEARQNGFLSQ